VVWLLLLLLAHNMQTAGGVFNQCDGRLSPNKMAAQWDLFFFASLVIFILPF